MVPTIQIKRTEKVSRNLITLVTSYSFWQILKYWKPPINTRHGANEMEEEWKRHFKIEHTLRTTYPFILVQSGQTGKVIHHALRSRGKLKGRRVVNIAVTGGVGYGEEGRVRLRVSHLRLARTDGGSVSQWRRRRRWLSRLPPLQRCQLGPEGRETFTSWV